MKKKSYLIVFLCCLIAGTVVLVNSCKKETGAKKNIEDTKTAIENVLKTDIVVYRDSGWAYLKTENDRVVVYQKTKKSTTNTFNRLIALTLDSVNLNLVKSDFVNDTLLFWYTKSQRQIIVYSPKKDKIVILALNDSVGTKLVRLFNKDKNLNSKTTSALGYGLSVANGSYNINSFLKTDAAGKISYVTPSYVPSSVLTINYMAPPKCDSGGIGSNQCSVTDGTLAGGSGCSVTCNAGYYACCVSDNVVCNCKAVPPPPKN